MKFIYFDYYQITGEVYFSEEPLNTMDGIVVETEESAGIFFTKIPNNLTKGINIITGRLNLASFQYFATFTDLMAFLSNSNKKRA